MTSITSSCYLLKTQMIVIKCFITKFIDLYILYNTGVILFSFVPNQLSIGTYFQQVSFFKKISGRCRFKTIEADKTMKHIIKRVSPGLVGPKVKFILP